MSQGEDSMSPTSTNCQQNDHAIQQPQETPQAEAEAESASLQARQRRRIAELEGRVESLESGRVVKERTTNYYLAQGRAIRCLITLFDGIEHLIAENDRRYENDGDEDATLDQDRLHTMYIALVNALPWFVKKATDMEHNDYVCMLKTLRQGADGARGDDTSKLKTLISDWVNIELKPNPPVESDDKHLRGFINDACGKLLCPAELDWSSPLVKAGIRDRSILVQAYKAVFTSPSSAKDVEGEGDGADVIENNRRAKRAFSGAKVKKHVAQIIRMDKVTPRSIAYIACQVRFALSSITSWQSVDGDFDYVQFWKTIVDFFEMAPGREAQHRVKQLLEWWTRKVFGRHRRVELSGTAKANLSMNALARQRGQLDDASFDSS